MADADRDKVLVQARELVKTYRRGSETLQVLDGISLEVEQGGFVALMGPSGSGKTTLLNMLGGIDRPDGGEISIGGTRIDQLSERALAGWRARHVGFVFQMFNLLPVLTAERNVELPLLLTGLGRAERRQRARTALALVGLEDRVSHKPGELSGGQEQRVGIARAIVTDPELLLCDEPTGDLDRASGDGILDLLAALNEQQGKTVVMVTHDPRAAERAHRVLHLDKGRLDLKGSGMKYLGLIWASLRRRKTRTALTLGSIVIAFLMFGLLSAMEKAFTAGVEIAGADRLMTIHKVSLIQSLPRAYLRRIAATDGVADVTHATWFGGYYQDPRQVIGVFPVDAESYMRIYPELEVPPQDMQSWYQTRNGMLVGHVLADRHGWSVGDRVPLRSSIYRQEDGGDTWDMVVSGIYRPRDNIGDASGIMLHYDFFNESLPERNRDMAGWYVVKVEDPERSAEIAAAIDSGFANSSYETKTSTEKAFAQGFANQVGDIGAIVTAVVAAVFFTMLLVTANTMAQSVRERTGELAVLKTLGFTNAAVTGLVLAEALVITVLGGVVGLALAWLVVVALGDKLRQFLPVFYLPWSDIAIGLLLVVVFGLVAGALPATQALRLRIADALRRG